MGSGVHRGLKIPAAEYAASLESRVYVRLLLAVNQQPSNSLLAVGGLAAAATTGALIAMGRRLGSAGVPFAAIGATLVHRTVSSTAVSLVFAGLVVHLVAVFIWSAVFLWIVRRYPSRVAAAAIVVAAGAFVVSWLVAWSSGAGLSSVLPLGDRLVLAVVLAGTLVLGMRFAFFPSQNA